MARCDPVYGIAIFRTKADGGYQVCLSKTPQPRSQLRDQRHSPYQQPSPHTTHTGQGFARWEAHQFTGKLAHTDSLPPPTVTYRVEASMPGRSVPYSLCDDRSLASCRTSRAARARWGCARPCTQGWTWGGSTCSRTPERPRRAPYPSLIALWQLSDAGGARSAHPERCAAMQCHSRAWS